MLTGTPLQNDLEELQNLLRFLMPKLFTAEEAEEIANVQASPTPRPYKLEGQRTDIPSMPQL